MDLQHSTTETERPKFTTSTPACKIKKIYNRVAEFILNVSDSFSFESEKTSTSLDGNKSSVAIISNSSKEDEKIDKLNIDVNSSYDRTGNTSNTSNNEAMNSDQKSMIFNDKSTSYDKSTISFKDETKSSQNIFGNYDNEKYAKSDSSSSKHTPGDEDSYEKDTTIDSGLNVFDEIPNVSEPHENLTETNSTSLTSLEDGSSNDKKSYTHIAEDATVQRLVIENALNDFSSLQDSLEDSLPPAEINSTSSTSLKNFDSSNNKHPCSQITTKPIESAEKTEEYNIDDEDYLLSDDLDDDCSTPDTLEEDLLMADSPILSCFEDGNSNDKSSCLLNANESTYPTEQGSKHDEDDYLFSDSLDERNCAKDPVEANLSRSAEESDSFPLNGFVSNNKNPDPHNANNATEPTQQMEKQNIDDDYLFSDTLKEFGSTPDLPEEILSTSDSPISDSQISNFPKRLDEQTENSSGSNSIQECSDSCSGNKSPYKSFKDLNSVQNLSTLCNASSENYTKHLNFCNFQWKVSENTNDASVQEKHFGSSSENCQNDKNSRDVATVSNDFSSENYTKHFKFFTFKRSESNNMTDTSSQVQNFGDSSENFCRIDKNYNEVVAPVSNDVPSENHPKRLKFCYLRRNYSESIENDSAQVKHFGNNVENSGQSDKYSLNVVSPASYNAFSENYPKRLKFDFKWSESDNIKGISSQVQNFESNAGNSYQNDKDSFGVIAKVLNTVSSENYPKHLKFRDFKWNECDNKKNTSTEVKCFGNSVETFCQNNKDSRDVIAPVSNEVCNTDSGITGSDILNFEINTGNKNSEYLTVGSVESVLPNDENANSPKDQLFRISDNAYESNAYKQVNSTSDNFLQMNPALENKLNIHHSDFINETIAKEASQSSAKYEYPDSPMNVETENLKDALELSGTLINEATPKEQLFDISSNKIDQSDKESIMEVDNNCSILSKSNEDNEMNIDSSDVELISPPEVFSPPESMDTDVLDAEPGPSSRGIIQNSFNLVSYRNTLKKHFTAKIAVEKAVKKALLNKNNRNKGLTLNQILKFISKYKLLTVHSKIDQDVLKYLDEAQKQNVLRFEKGKYIIGNQKKKTSTLQKIKQVVQNKMPSILQNKASYSLRSKASYSLRSNINKKNLKINVMKTPKSNKSPKKTPESKIKNSKKTPQSAKGSVFKKLRSRTVLKKK